jgi:hypothetical protein
MSEKDWEGDWKVTYFYENEPNLLYTGTLFLNYKDTLEGRLEVVAPMSQRTELLELSSLRVSDEGKKLRGSALHTGYKINEGYLQEQFELRLEGTETFSGSGSCVAFCAEGTEGVRIRWKGIKSDITSTIKQ